MFKLKDVKLNTGATLDKQGNPVAYSRGYQVSAQDLEVMPVYRLTKKHLKDILNHLADSQHLGIWIDNRKVYIDCSEHITTKREAMKLGKMRKQLSIWNWKAGEAIAC